jgi:hypothetical protein
MLKTHTDGRVWLVTQPDHGQLAGYLAAHWGNQTFSVPGYYTNVPDPERLRAEIVFAVAQHDNGWWEWEASPDLDHLDALPLGLADVLKDQQAGMNRWRLGLSRFPENPYVNLVISSHAYWLYAVRILSQPNPAFTHPLFWKTPPEILYPGSQDAPQAFLRELEQQQSQWTSRLRSDPSTSDWLDPESLSPHVRLLQLCDGMSLALSSNLISARDGQTKGLGQDEYNLQDVPRQSWADRVTIRVTPLGGRRIALNPYPFDVDPLPVSLPVMIADDLPNRPRDFRSWRQAQVPQMLTFQLESD